VALPALPADVLRMIWQAKWRAAAASVVQRAWRRRERLASLERFERCVFYLIKYVVVEFQNRGRPHVHIVIS
jgi:hypothetical protein